MIAVTPRRHDAVMASDGVDGGVDGVMGEVVAAVDRLLATDVDALDDVALAELVAGVFREESRFAAVRARLVLRWAASGCWAADGSRTAAAALARDTMASSRRAGAEVHRARALVSMPATAAALADGRLSVEYVDLLVRANQSWRDAVFADHEQTLVDEIAGLRYEQARRVIEYWCQRADADAADARAVRDREQAHVHLSTTIDGTVVLDGVLDAVRGAIVSGELQRLEHDLSSRTGVAGWCARRRSVVLMRWWRWRAARRQRPVRRRGRCSRCSSATSRWLGCASSATARWSRRVRCCRGCARRCSRA
jgi:hypothetical protein